MITYVYDLFYMLGLLIAYTAAIMTVVAIAGAGLAVLILLFTK